VTENCDGFPSHFSFFDGISSQFPSEIVKGNKKKLIESVHSKYLFRKKATALEKKKKQ